VSLVREGGISRGSYLPGGWPARGTPLDVGRKQRTLPTSLRRALWSRDRGCTFPGCVIPRGGYRPDDMIDDMPGVSLAATSPSAEGLMVAIVQGRRDIAEELMVELAERANPSADGSTTTEYRNRSLGEVREPAALYQVDRRAE